MQKQVAKAKERAFKRREKGPSSLCVNYNITEQGKASKNSVNNSCHTEQGLPGPGRAHTSKSELGCDFLSKSLMSVL